LSSSESSSLESSSSELSTFLAGATDDAGGFVVEDIFFGTLKQHQKNRMVSN